MLYTGSYQLPILHIIVCTLGFPGGSDGKESFCNAEDLGSVSGWEDPLEEGMATHLSILDWRFPRTAEPRTTVCAVAESEVTERLSTVCAFQPQYLS